HRRNSRHGSSRLLRRNPRASPRQRKPSRRKPRRRATCRESSRGEMKQAVATSPEGSSRAPRVSFCTLGCRLNQYDTSALRARLLSWGMEEGQREPDVIVVNTCTVTGRADQEARQLLRRLHRESPGARIVVTGCYAQRAAEEVRSLPGVSAVLGTADREDPEALMRAVGWGPGEEARHGGDATFFRASPARAARDFTSPAALHVGRA